MRSKFVYSCNIKIPASGFNKLLETIFYLLLVVKAFFLKKVVKMLEEVVVDWWEVRLKMVDEAKLLSPVCSPSEALVVQRMIGHCHGEELG